MKKLKGIFPCPDCARKFRDEELLTIHLEWKHNKPPSQLGLDEFFLRFRQ